MDHTGHLHWSLGVLEMGVDKVFYLSLWAVEYGDKNLLCSSVVGSVLVCLLILFLAKPVTEYTEFLPWAYSIS